ncbi:MAG: NlpC/P60 family protein [Candidatus Eremiobacterota bacterium]
MKKINLIIAILFSLLFLNIHNIRANHPPVYPPVIVDTSSIYNAAKEWVGTPYNMNVGHNDSKEGIDCSHLVWEVYKAADYKYSKENVSTKDFPSLAFFKQVDSFANGDVILFKKNDSKLHKKGTEPGHMGIFWDGKFINASRKKGVILDGNLYWWMKTSEYTYVGSFRWIGISGVWEWCNGHVKQILPNGTVYTLSGNTDIGTWEYNGNGEYIIRWGSKGIDTLNVSSSGTYLYGVNLHKENVWAKKKSNKID